MRLLPTAVVGVIAVMLTGAARVAASDLAACSSGTYASPGHGYAGFQSHRRGHGIRALLTPLTENSVRKGHVAAWVGVGGPRQGPNGTDEWLQVGLASFRGSARNLYYEVKRPATQSAFKLLEENVVRGESRHVSVLELGDRPNWWRVWVDGSPASRPIHLRASTGRWRPIATAEAWDGGFGVCNRFAFRFQQVEVAAGRGGSWKRFRSGERFQDKGYRLSQLEERSPLKGRSAQASGGATSFVAASA